MKVEDWISDIQKKYFIEIRIQEGKSYFDKKIYNISDPNSKGLSFVISSDDKDSPTIFGTVKYPFSRFNIAEYVSQDDIFLAARTCLEGDLSFKKDRSGDKTHLSFSLKTFKGKSSETNISIDSKEIENFLSGYTKQKRQFS